MTALDEALAAIRQAETWLAVAKQCLASASAAGSGRPSEASGSVETADGEVKIVTTTERLMSGTREEFGSVQGRLRTVSDKAGAIQFVVFDDLYDKGINCFVSEEIAESVIKAFRKRVVVQGLVKYDKAGRAMSIKVETIREFMDAAELPTLNELYDIFNKAG